MNTFKRVLPVKTFILSILVSGSVFALDHKLVDITNDEDRETTRFILKTDDNNDEVNGFIKQTLNRHGGVIQTTTMGVNGVYSNHGIVLEKRDGRIIVALKSDNFATHNGGNIEVDTLYNGVTSTRKQYDLELARAGRSWELLRDGRPVSKMHLKSKKIPLVGTVGISDIVTR